MKYYLPFSKLYIKNDMNKMPAHKNMIDPPGQFRNELPEELVKLATGQIVNPITEQTLGQYIERKQKETPKKMTFDEWYNPKDGPWSWQFDPEIDFQTCLKSAWNAGQENK